MVHDVTLAGSECQKEAIKAFRAMMKKSLTKKLETIEFLTSSCAVGCRRLTPGPGYLQALVDDNVEFISMKIRSIPPKGVELDALVCATGFNAAGPPPFKVIGKNGANLSE